MLGISGSAPSFSTPPVHPGPCGKPPSAKPPVFGTPRRVPRDGCAKGSVTGGRQVSDLALGLVLRAWLPSQSAPPLQNFLTPTVKVHHSLSPSPWTPVPRTPASGLPACSHQTHSLRKPRGTCAAAPPHGGPVRLPPRLRTNALSHSLDVTSPPLCVPHGLWSRSLRKPAVTCSDVQEPDILTLFTDPEQDGPAPHENLEPWQPVFGAPPLRPPLEGQRVQLDSATEAMLPRCVTT